MTKKPRNQAIEDVTNYDNLNDLRRELEDKIENVRKEADEKVSKYTISLALKIGIPIVATIIIAVIVWGFWVERQIVQIQSLISIKEVLRKG